MWRSVVFGRLLTTRRFTEDFLVVMDELNKKIRQLACKRNEYFLRNRTASQETFLREIKQDCQNLVLVSGNQTDEFNLFLSEIPILPGHSALTSYFTGRILNLNPKFVEQAVDSLNNSLRMDVKNAEAWIELGKCAWKKPDLDQALTCFKQAVEIKSDPRSLCYYAAALRSQASSSTIKKEKLLLIKRCLEMCKTATDQDPTYPFAWNSLANTYLLRFFATAQLDRRDLDHSIESYEKALSQERPFINPDLHINYHEALLYKQDYRLALHHAHRAVQIEPYFEDATERLESLQVFLMRLNEGINRRGMLPLRKIKELIGTLNGVVKSEETRTFDELTRDDNPGVLIYTKIVSVISHNNKVPFTTVAIDQKANCFGVTVFNFSNSFNLMVGDLLLIPAPLLFCVDDFEINGTKLNFQLIRVDDPSTLVRNDKLLGGSARALTDASFEVKNK